MKAAIYARYSTNNQREASIEDQVRGCELLAAQHGFLIVARFEDRGLSAGTTDRPGYQSLLAAARAGEFEIILAEDISRLWRSGAEYGPRAAELEDAGLNLVTAVGDDTRREGWGMMLAIKQAMAEQYRKETSYRTRRGLEGRALAGAPTGSRKYGYRSGAIYEPEAAIVRRIFEMSASGMTQQAICDQLNYEEVPAPKGGKHGWRQQTVANLLKAERYQGKQTFGKTIIKRSARDSKQTRRLVREGGPLVSRFNPALQIVTPFTSPGSEQSTMASLG